MKLLCLPKYDSAGASSRYRTHQFLRHWRNDGIEITVEPLITQTSSDGPIKNRLRLIRTVLKRLARMVLYSYDGIYLEKEALPYIPWSIEMLLWKLHRGFIIVDYDDAIFHNYDRTPNYVVRALLRSKIPKLLNHCDFVSTGSPYLTSWIESNSTCNVKEIPTSVNYKLYEPSRSLRQQKSSYKSQWTVGWIGSRSTSQFLIPLIPVLRNFCDTTGSRLLLIGDKTSFDPALADFAEIRQWSHENEQNDLSSIDVGIMPLPSTPFARGKCGFKLIQYMASGAITISTPLEANLKIDRGGVNYFADTADEWLTALHATYDNRLNDNRDRHLNCSIVNEHYNSNVNHCKYAELFHAAYLQYSPL